MAKQRNPLVVAFCRMAVAMANFTIRVISERGGGDVPQALVHALRKPDQPEPARSAANHGPRQLEYFELKYGWNMLSFEPR